MKKILLNSFILFSFYSSIAQVQIWQENFETHGNGSRYTSSSDFYTTEQDYFGRIRINSIDNNRNGVFYLDNNTNNNNIRTQNTYSNINGEYYYAGEDMNQPGTPIEGIQDGNAAKSIIFSGINISGATNIQFRGLFARGDTNTTCGASDYDDNDHIEVYYSIDGGAEIKGMCFNADLNCTPGSTTQQPLHHDPDCDGDGGEGAMLTNELSEFTFNIPATGDLINIRVEVSMNTGAEEVALDNLRLFSDTNTLAVNTFSNEKEVIIYPNPAKNHIIIHSNNTTIELQKIELFDLLGKRVKNVKINKVESVLVDLTNLKSGMYLINLISKTGQIYKRKLIVK